MCVIIVKPKGAPLPTYDNLRVCARQNPHGCGFAAQGVKPFKSLSFDAFYRRLMCEDESKPMILHFRYATHGSVCVNNCHPFYDPQTGVTFAHNGVLSVQCMRGRTDSETAFRRLFLPVIKAYGLHSKQLANAVDCVIGGSRFAFMDARGRIRTFGNFFVHDNCLYSNPNSYRNVWLFNDKSLSL